MRKLTFLSDKHFWINTIFLAALFYLIAVASYIFINACFQATHVSTFAANGTFQLYNPLRRLDQSQIVGYDFPFFHGIGIPLLHFPIFELLGSKLFAAEFAKWFVSPVIYLGSTFIFFFAFFKKIRKSIIATAIMTLFALACIDVVWPGNSLIGLRGTFPVLAAAALLWKTSRKITIRSFNIKANELVALALLGIAPLFGTEQGLAAILAYSVINFVIILHRLIKKKAIKKIIIEGFHLFIKMAVIGTTSLLAYTIATAGHPLSAIRYALIDVPQDQGWYFGTDPAPFLEWHNFLPDIFNFPMRFMLLFIALGAIASFTIIRLTKKNNLQISYAICFMIAYGVIAFAATAMGYYFPGAQLIPLQRVMALFSALCIVYVLFDDRIFKSYFSKKPKRQFIIYLSYILLFITLIHTGSNLIRFVANTYDARSTVSLAKSAINTDDYSNSSEGWRNTIDIFRPYLKSNDEIWSTYTGVYDSYFGDQLNQSSGGEDYIIHALGDARREQYLESFKQTQPKYVTTLRPEYFNFEEWLWGDSWEFYQELLAHYELKEDNASHYLWQRREPSKPTTLIASHTLYPDDNSAYILPTNNTSRPIIYTVTISYSATSPLHLLDKIPRYLININGDFTAQQYRISLPSHKKQWSFPVVVMPNSSNATLSKSVHGIIPFASLDISSVQYKEFFVADSNLKPFIDNFCYYRTLSLPKDYPINCSVR